METAMLVLTVVGILVAIVGVLVTYAIYKLTAARRPHIQFEGQGTLSRCLTPPVFEKGWGIVSLAGKMRVSHQPVTVVDAELSYMMDPAHVRPNSKYMGETFPPLFVFERVANDERASTVALRRQDFDSIRLVPGHGEQPVRIHFTLGGNFAEEYSKDFFDGTFSSVSRMFVPMMVRFEYEYNGQFFWTEKFSIHVCPFGNQGWTPDGPKYIDASGRLLDVRHGPVVYGNGSGGFLEHI